MHDAGAGSDGVASRLTPLMERLRSKHQHSCSWADMTKNLKMTSTVSTLTEMSITLHMSCG